jgi:hypothetical protein
MIERRGGWRGGFEKRCALNLGAAAGETEGLPVRHVTQPEAWRFGTFAVRDFLESTVMRQVGWCALGLWVVGLVGGAGQAFGQAKLEWKLTPNSTWVNEIEVETRQTLKIAGMNVDSESRSKQTQRSTVGERDGLNRLKVKQKLEQMQVTMKQQGLQFDFDSRSPDEKGSSQLEVLRPLYKSLLALESDLVYDKDNQPVDVEFDQQFLNSLDANVQAQIRSQIDPANQKRGLKQLSERFPPTAVAKGDTWERTEMTDLGGAQTMKVRRSYTHEGLEEHEGRPCVKLTMKVLSVELSAEGGTTPVKIKPTELKSDGSDGVSWFDVQLGDVVEERQTLKAVGPLKLEINGMELPAELDLEMKTSTKRVK